MISNPNSTSQSDALFRQVIPLLRDVEGAHMRMQFTHYAGHAEEIVRGMTRTDFDAIVVFGGDGTVNEVVNGLLGPADRKDRPRPEELPVLGVVPTGSANVFVRALGIPNTPVEAAHVLARLMERDTRRKIHLGTWNDRWFAVNAGFGLDADVLARVDRAREMGFSATPLRYLAVSAQAYLRARVIPPEISVHAVSRAGEQFTAHKVPLMFTSNTNPWTFLGPLPVVTNPRNSFDAGLGLFGVSDLGGIHGLVGMLHLMGVTVGACCPRSPRRVRCSSMMHNRLIWRRQLRSASKPTASPWASSPRCTSNRWQMPLRSSRPCSRARPTSGACERFCAT